MNKNLQSLNSFSSFCCSRRAVVSYKQKYVREVLVNHLIKLAQEKLWLGELTIAVDEAKFRTTLKMDN